MIFHVVKWYFTSVGDISRRQANTRVISDIFHFTAIHFLPERHSAMVLYICLWSKKKFESYFRDRLTFSNVDSRTSRWIYRLALLLRAPETLSSLSKSRISIFNAHLTLLVRKMTSHNSIGKYRHLVNWLGTCLGTERRRLQTRLVECRTGRKWISGAPLFTLVIFYFHEGRQHNIDDVCVEFCWILFYSWTYLL